MKKVIAALCIVFIWGVSAFCQVNCPPKCYGYADGDWVTVDLVEQGNSVPVGGYIIIYTEIFATLADGCHEPIEYIIERRCINEIARQIMVDPGKGGMCALICGTPGDCDGNHDCNCGIVTHSMGFFYDKISLWDKGKFLVKFEGEIIFEHEFDYGDGMEPTELEFNAIRFINLDGSPIVPTDIFDVNEPISLEVTATFEEEPNQDAVGVVLSSDINEDSIVVSLLRTEGSGNTAIYSGQLSRGIFLNLIPDPESSLPPKVRR